MPKVLNVAKLEKKFQTLSRSRESIQGLSLWIMNHKEVYQDIVDHWLIGISKRINTLSMFFVANEVIQGCGKKRCPEFREAFSKVIEKAASFENVKEIKKDVIRLLSLWKERNIYDEDFKQIIEIKLNSASVEELSEEELEDEKEEEEEELTEAEIIKQFKKDNLIDKLKSVKSLESEIKEKEDILNYAEVPEMPDLDDIIVRKGCQDMMRKCDKYLTLIRDSSELARKEIKLRKKLLQELKNSCVFYTAQQRDVKEVYNAFRIYGKRVKVMETRLSEKMSTLPFVDSPCFSEDNMSMSTSNYFSPCDTDASIASKSPLGMSPILLNEPSQSSCSSSNLKQSFSFSGKITKESISELLESVKQVSQRKSVDESSISELATSNSEKVFDSVKEEQLHKHPICDKQSSLSEKSPNIENKQERNIPHNESSNCGMKVGDTSSKDTDFMEQIKSSQEQATKQFSAKEASSSENDTKSSPDKEEKQSSCIGTVSAQVKVESILDKRTVSTSQSRVSEQQEQPKSTTNRDAEDVDFLLDESYDNKKTKINLSYKRKIEFLLKSKGKKPCTDPSSKELPEKVPVKKDSPNQMDLKLKTERKDERGITEINSTQVEITQDGSKEVEGREEIDSLNLSEKNIHETGSLMDSLSNNHSENSFDTNNTFADSGLETLAKPKDNTSSFNLSGTFTGSALSSLMSGMSTDFLRNILQTNQQKSSTETQDDCDQKALPEVQFNSPGKKTLPNIFHDLKFSDIPKEESPRNDSTVTLSNLNDISGISETVVTSLSVKTESSALPQYNQKSTLLESDTASNSYIMDELKSVSKIEVPFLCVEKVEEILPSDNIQDISSESLSVSNNELLNKKPNLLETLHNVLECLSENMMSGCNVKNLPPENCTELEPPLSLESCMKIYEYLHGDGSTLKTENNLSCIEISSKVKPAASSIENNYGVVDMECDSEEED